jgi:glycosyltransferase involved in cell wall biosynthesis
MISVIIPIFNSSKTIKGCLDSILAQTYKDIEVIVVDDKSTDNSIEILNNYINKFKIINIELKIIKHDKNKGAPTTRNTGFRKSKGDLLYFCDSDAILKTNALSTLTNAIMLHEDVGYIYSSFIWGKKYFKVGDFGKKKLMQGPFMHTNSLIRRECFPKKGWDESIKRFQDWDLWLTMLENGHIGYWINEILFTIKPGGTMSGWLPSIFYKTLPFLPSVKKYKKSVLIIKNKHNLI